MSLRGSGATAAILMKEIATSASGGLAMTKFFPSKHILDRWIVARLHEFIKEVTENMEAYKLSEASRPIQDFIADLSQWYLRRSRERFKGKKSEQRAALGTTSYVLGTLSQLLAPFMPFLAEHIWQNVMEHGTWNMEQKPSPGLQPPSPSGRGEGEGVPPSVHLTDWPKFKKTKIDAELLEHMKLTRKIVELAHAARAEAKIKVRQPLQELRIKNSELRMDAGLLKLIAEEVNVKHVVMEGPHPDPLPAGEGRGEGLP